MNTKHEASTSGFERKLSAAQDKRARSDKKKSRAGAKIEAHITPVTATQQALQSCLLGSSPGEVVRFTGEKILIEFERWAPRWKELAGRLTIWPGTYILDVVPIASSVEEVAREILRDAASQNADDIAARMQKLRDSVGQGDAIGLSRAEIVMTDLGLWTFLEKLEQVLSDPLLLARRLGQTHREILKVFEKNPHGVLLGKEIATLAGRDLNSIGRELSELVLFGYLGKPGKGYAMTASGLEIVGKSTSSDPTFEK